MDCIFCKIINKEIPTEIVFENDHIVAFKDIHPKAPTHILIVPRKHVESINHLGSEDRDVIAEIILVAPKIAEIMKTKDGYKLAFNVGRKGGQIVDHLHMHLLAWPEDDKEAKRKEVAPI